MLIAVIGALFVFAVPGFFLTKLLFKAEPLEELALIPVLSISFYTLLGVLLGLSELNKRLTGGLGMIWIYSIILNGVLAFLYFRKINKQ